VNDPRSQRVWSLFRQVQGRPEDERGAFLDAACGEDRKLRGEVENLLNAKPQPTGDVDEPTIPFRNGAPPQEFGPYHLLEKVGEGGMGEVWEAEQTRPVRRRVALKIIKRGMDSEQVVARFEAERQALALMDHPGVAKVLDAGTTPRGRPYFVMEYVRGIPITSHCDRNRLTLTERIELLCEVCSGVQHAHQKAIIHRDLKPSNILVAIQDGRAVPKIIDFGVAKATAQRLTDNTLVTQLGNVIGTPEYMSPEQADPTAQDVDTRTDIYSLGVLLYELVVGVLPFTSSELRRAGMSELVRKIREEDPPRLGARLGSLDEQTLRELARNRRMEPRSLRARLRGDLDWITIKALDKDPARRYQTPIELADDLRRHLDQRAVKAGPPSAVYRLRKFAMRNRVVVCALAASLLVLSVGAIVSTFFAIREASQRKEAQAALQIATAAVDEMLTHVGSESLSDIPQMEHVRLELLTRAEALYGSLTHQSGSTPGLELQAALAHSRLAQVHRLKGEKPEAEEKYRQSIAKLEALVSLHPDRAEYDGSLAALYDRLASLVGDDPERAQEAWDLFAKAIEKQERLVDLQSDEPEHRRNLMRFLNNRGILLKDSVVIGDSEGAERDFRQAIEIAGPPSRRPGPLKSDFLQGLARSHNNLAILLKDQRRLDEVEASYRKAAEAFEALYMDHPADREYAMELGKTYNNLANLLIERKGYDDAERLNTKALALFHELAEPLPDYRSELANTHNSRGILLGRLGQGAESIVAFERACEIFEDLLEDFPDRPNDSYRLAMALISVGDAYRLRGDTPKAKQTYAKLTRVMPSVPEDRRDWLEATRQYRSLEILIAEND